MKVELLDLKKLVPYKLLKKLNNLLVILLVYAMFVNDCLF